MFKELRNKKGFTQVELAEKLDVLQSTISNWETGTSKPDILTAAKIAEIFDCSVEEVVKCFVQDKQIKKRKKVNKRR